MVEQIFNKNNLVDCGWSSARLWTYEQISNFSSYSLLLAQLQHSKLNMNICQFIIF